ncbi:MAG: mannose-1-phosphate guanyltransferase, partial [Actinomycetota bacterium]
SVVMDGAHHGQNARMPGCELGRGASLDQGPAVEEGSILGDEVVVGAGAIVKPKVRIYPAKSVEAGAIVTESLVRERRASRHLFGARGVTGLVNVGITPQVAVRLGMAFGTMLKRGSVIVTGRDASRSARTMKRAIIAGLNSTGIDVSDLELTPMPLTRFTVRAQQAAGGISVRTSPKDPESVEIRFFDADGADITEATQRKVERLFFREDYRRAGPSKIGELEFPPRALEQYTAGIIRSTDVDAIRQLSPKVVVDYAYGSTSLVGPSLLGRLGCDVLAVNAFADEHRPVLVSRDLDGLLDDLCEHVRKSGSTMGVLLEPGGEIARIVDDGGRLVSHERALMAFIQHEVARGATRVAVPVSCSRACEDVAAAGGAELEWTPATLPALMARASSPDVDFAGNSEGALIFPGFGPGPDALMTFVKALELAAIAGRPLSQVIDDLPDVHIAVRDVATPWELKGAVMRSVASVEVPGTLVLVDGVKVVEDDRWALVIPFPDEPLCRVWAEAATDAGAEEMADRYATLVENVVANGPSEETY